MASAIQSSSDVSFAARAFRTISVSAVLGLLGAGATMPAVAGEGAGPRLGSPLPAPARGLQSLARTQTLLYVAAETGVNVYTESGHPMGTFATATGADTIGMDDAGDVYVAYVKGKDAHIARYAIGGKKPLSEDAPACPKCGGIFQVSHQGEVVYFYIESSGAVFSPAWDVWDAGKTGKPSRTFKYSGGEYGFALDNAGALYIPYFDSTSGTQRYDEIPAGSAKPSRTIVDSIVPASEVSEFDPYTMTPLSDGTLYVGEWTFSVGDPLAGLYVYPVQGKERFVSNGASNPAATAVDALGKVYVLNSNFGFSTSGYTCDTAHTLSIYSKNATSLVSQVTSGFTNGQFLTVAGNGDAFISEFAYFPSQSCTSPQGDGAIALAAPGDSTATTIVPNLPNEDLSLYDGSVATNYDSQAVK